MSEYNWIKVHQTTTITINWLKFKFSDEQFMEILLNVLRSKLNTYCKKIFKISLNFLEYWTERWLNRSAECAVNI